MNAPQDFHNMTADTIGKDLLGPDSAGVCQQQRPPLCGRHLAQDAIVGEHAGLRVKAHLLMRGNDVTQTGTVVKHVVPGHLCTSLRHREMRNTQVGDKPRRVGKPACRLAQGLWCVKNVRDEK